MSGVSLKYQSLSLAIAGYRWLSLIAHCYRYNIQLYAKTSSQSWDLRAIDKMVSKKESDQKGVDLCTFTREVTKPNASGTVWARIRAQRSSTLLLHSIEFASNYRVALSLLWVPEDESKLNWVHCFSLSNNHHKKSIFDSDVSFQWWNLEHTLRNIHENKINWRFVLLYSLYREG